jgi:hypothetical protein
MTQQYGKRLPPALQKKYNKQLNPYVIAKRNRIALVSSFLFLSIIGWILFFTSSLPLLIPIIVTVLFVLSATFHRVMCKKQKLMLYKTKTEITKKVYSEDDLFNYQFSNQNQNLTKHSNANVDTKKQQFKPIPKPTYTEKEIVDFANTKPIDTKKIDDAVKSAITLIKSSKKVPIYSPFLTESESKKLEKHFRKIEKNEQNNTASKIAISK